MKNQIIVSLSIFAVVLTTSCKAQRVKEVPVTVLEINDTTIDKNPIADIYDNYIGIKNSLAKDNPDSAAIFARRLFKATDKIEMDKLTAKQHTEWMKYAKKISYDAEHIKGTVELEHQREHFISLSEYIYELLKSFGTNNENVYYQFCPMANNGKGAYWISEQSKIFNPYFGRQMQSCGSTKETITPKK